MVNINITLRQGLVTEVWHVANVRTSRQGVKNLQFLNDIIESRHGFKNVKKFHKYRVFIKKTLNL